MFLCCVPFFLDTGILFLCAHSLFYTPCIFVQCAFCQCVHSPAAVCLHRSVCSQVLIKLVIPEGFSKFVVNYHGAIHRMQHLFLSETVFVSLKSVQQKPSCAS